MKYLVKDYNDNTSVIITGNSKKEIILKALERFLDDNWVEDLRDSILSNYDLDFIDIENLEVI